ncbi:MAG: hypothetical protein J7604_00955 [Sporocytophaga sp.]|uniref:hypothetical protein n=1 Tax=Sporocytophaga sp. TaxID=2231183 RepID=UPI001B1511FE|nr:hypothetical protein [Sporocytophaga sp.]MBO9698740.1 hypothetical protein [Sporocytophaga sp.]
MKNLFFTFLIAISFLTSSGQVVSFDYIISRREETVERIDLKDLPKNTFVIEMDFSKTLIKNKSEIDSIKQFKIAGIDLIYSGYKSNNSFSQEILNRERLKNLFQLYPLLFDNNLIHWRLIKQNAAKNRKEADSLFHGFIFHVQPKDVIKDRDGTVREMTSNDEIKFVKDFLTKACKDDVFKERHISCRDTIIIKQDTTGKYLPKSKKKLENGTRYKSRSVWNRKIEVESLRDTIQICDTVWRSHEKLFHIENSLRDTVVLKFLANYKDSLFLGNAVVVEDVTGSMYPYLTQTFLWRRKNISNVNRFVFFNDGDNMDDSKKIIGKTGGIYGIQSSNIDSVENEAFKTMKKGGGGDGPENNLEACLYALNKFPNGGSLIMIADNYAQVKDISLLSNINKPVKIILCGVRQNIMADYIQIAYNTGGSLHTIEEDIYGLKTLKDNEEIRLGAQTFLFKGGKFFLIK